MVILASRGLTRLASSAVSYWEALREIHFGQWQEALRSARLCDVREADFSRLPPGNRDAPHLLQSRLLHRSLQQRNPAS